jgi:hypothetical protein
MTRNGSRRGTAISFGAGLVLVVAACGAGAGPADSGAPITDAGLDVTADAPPVEAATEAASPDAADVGPPLDASFPVAAGSTGAFGVVAVNGQQKMYLPSTTMTSTGNATLAVVDVGVAGSGAAGAAALIHSIDLGVPAGATTTGGDASTIVAASTETNDVWFIDPSTDTVVKHITLDATYGESFFSAGGGYVTGIAVDAALHTAILGVWNGFALVDLATDSITHVIQAPPSENFGYDSNHRLLYAPFYDCRYSFSNGQTPASCGTPQTLDGGAITAGLSVIDLTDGTVYTYEDPTAADPTMPLGSNPDSAGVDPASQLVVVPAEHEGYSTFLDFSMAKFDKTTNTVTAPHAIVQGLADEGVALEPTSHIAFWEGENSANVAAASAPLLGATTGGFVQSFVQGTMPDLPEGGAFTNLGDPHGISVATSILDGKPVGFVVDAGRRWVARVELSMLVALEPADASLTLTTPELQAAVTYLDGTTME